jgi:transcriptional regulator with GAF, ATPase, and Fis domain
MDSELFGHEKGAFTGALSQKRGRFERANKGTIFLDEVGELQPEAQVRLLRVLQEKEIERVGGTAPITLDIRIIAATNRDLETMIRDGNFREDLYFRLMVFPIPIPPLRERMGDIPSLVQYFLQKKSQEIGLKDIPSVAPEGLERLMTYPWPGNVRELENVVERALILGTGDTLAFNDFRVPLKAESHVAFRETSDRYPKLPGDEPSLAVDTVVSGHIRRVLDMAGGKVGGKGGAAQMLHINPSTLRKKMRKLGIPFGRKAKKE